MLETLILFVHQVGHPFEEYLISLEIIPLSQGFH